MEHASKRAPSRHLDRAWGFVDMIVTLTLGLAAAYAISMGRVNGATAAALFAVFRGLRAARRWRLR
jgi:hypothetical protein